MKVQTVPSRLTDRAVLNAKPQPNRYKISDDYGLYLLVMPKGSKHWRFDYRFAGARRTFSIGPYPLFSLAEARDERDKARKLLRDGIDPGERRKQERAVEELTASATFSVIADDVLQRMEKERRAEATLTKTRWLLDFARPNLGNLPISEITAPQILAVLRKIEDRRPRPGIRGQVCAIWIFCSCAAAGFGSVIFSTPLLIDAVISSGLMPGGRARARSNEPWLRS